MITVSPSCLRSAVLLLFRLNRDKGTTLVLVTHDEHLASRCERLIHLEAGRVAPGQKVASRV